MGWDQSNFGSVTESLVKDLFIVNMVNMSNKDVPQKLCTEPKATIADTIQFTISFEEGALRKQLCAKLDNPNLFTKADPSELNNINAGVKPRGNKQKVLSL